MVIGFGGSPAKPPLSRPRPVYRVFPIYIEKINLFAHNYLFLKLKINPILQSRSIMNQRILTFSFSVFLVAIQIRVLPRATRNPSLSKIFFKNRKFSSKPGPGLQSMNAIITARLKRQPESVRILFRPIYRNHSDIKTTDTCWRYGSHPNAVLSSATTMKQKSSFNRRRGDLPPSLPRPTILSMKQNRKIFSTLTKRQAASGNIFSGWIEGRLCQR